MHPALPQALPQAMPPALPQALPLDLVARYAVSAFLALLTWWLDQDPAPSAEQMNETYWSLAMPGIRENLLANQVVSLP